jgi:uncharacterized protein (DUF2225 family)
MLLVLSNPFGGLDMEFTMTRRAALVGLASLACGRWATADTFRTVKRTCPICSTEYETNVTASGTQLGVRLDLRPIGPIASPPRIGVCTKCEFVDFRHGEEYPEKELKTLKEYVLSDDYKKLAKGNTSYFLVGQMYEKLERPPVDTGFVYLYSVWQTENDKEKDRLKKCLSASLAAFEKSLEDKERKAEQRQTIQILKGELLRRLGKFADAKDHFERLAKDDAFKTDPLPRLIEQQLEWIAKKNDQPQKFAPKKDEK